jgi:hypothetical protein
MNFDQNRLRDSPFAEIAFLVCVKSMHQGLFVRSSVAQLAVLSNMICAVLWPEWSTVPKWLADLDALALRWALQPARSDSALLFLAERAAAPRARVPRLLLAFV